MGHISCSILQFMKSMKFRTPFKNIFYNPPFFYTGIHICKDWWYWYQKHLDAITDRDIIWTIKRVFLSLWQKFMRKIGKKRSLAFAEDYALNITHIINFHLRPLVQRMRRCIVRIDEQLPFSERGKGLKILEMTLT